MPWVRVDDSLPNHPDFVGKPDAVLALYIRGMCYANRHLTDGFLDDAVVKDLGAKPTALEVLERAKDHRWTRVEGGWQIQQYAKKQPTRASVEAKRAAGNERLKRFREARRRERQAAGEAADRQQRETPSETALQADAKREGNGVTGETRNAGCNANPNPTQVLQEQEITPAPLPRRVTPVEELTEPSFLQAMAIAHGAADAFDQRQTPWTETNLRDEFKAICLEQGLNYAARHAAHERPLVDRVVDAVMATRRNRTAKAEARPAPARRAVGGRR